MSLERREIAVPDDSPVLNLVNKQGVVEPVFMIAQKATESAACRCIPRRGIIHGKHKAKSLRVWIGLCVVTLSAAVLMAKEAAAQGWVSPNMNGVVPDAADFSKGYAVIGIEVMEQAGYGIVNIRCILYNSESKKRTTSAWVTRNMRGQSRITELDSTKENVEGIEFKEQAGYGLVDVRLIYNDRDGNQRRTRWATGNSNGTTRSLVVPTGTKRPIGFEVREQAVYGVINFRLLSPRT